MADPTTPTTALPPGDPIARDLADIHKQVRDLKAIQASGRHWVLGTTLAVIALFAIFSYATYEHIKRNFDQAAMQKAVSEHGDAVMPVAMRLLQQTGQDLFPVYRDAALAKLKADGPKAASAAVDQVRQVPEQTGKEFQQKLQAAFDAAVTKVEPDFKAAFPNVTDEKRQQIMSAFVAEQIDAQNKRIASRVNQLYTNDLIHMQGTLDKFQLPDTSGTPAGQDELERRFLHTMVALLDDQVDTALPAPATTGGNAGMASVRMRPTTGPTTGPTAGPTTAPGVR